MSRWQQCRLPGGTELFVSNVHEEVTLLVEQLRPGIQPICTGYNKEPSACSLSAHESALLL